MSHSTQTQTHRHGQWQDQWCDYSHAQTHKRGVSVAHGIKQTPAEFRCFENSGCAVCCWLCWERSIWNFVSTNHVCGQIVAADNCVRYVACVCASQKDVWNSFATTEYTRSVHDYADTFWITSSAVVLTKRKCYSNFLQFYGHCKHRMSPLTFAIIHDAPLPPPLCSYRTRDASPIHVHCCNHHVPPNTCRYKQKWCVVMRYNMDPSFDCRSGLFSRVTQPLRHPSERNARQKAVAVLMIIRNRKRTTFIVNERTRQPISYFSISFFLTILY